MGWRRRDRGRGCVGDARNPHSDPGRSLDWASRLPPSASRGGGGHPRIAVTALVFFAIPLPTSVVGLTSPALETALARAAGAILGGLGAPVEAIGFSLVAPAGRIDLGPVDGGANLAFAFAALGWYSAVRAGGGDIRRAALRGVCSALLAIPLQPLVIVAAGALLGAGLPAAGLFWLRQGSWIAGSALGLAWLHRPSFVKDGRLGSRSPSP